MFLKSPWKRAFLAFAIIPLALLRNGFRITTIASLCTFAAGALVPLLPWFLWSGTRAAVASILLGSIAALAVGGALGFLGGRNLAWSAARQLFVLAIAAGATWAVGRLFNVTVS